MKRFYLLFFHFNHLPFPGQHYWNKILPHGKANEWFLQFFMFTYKSKQFIVETECITECNSVKWH